MASSGCVYSHDVSDDQLFPDLDGTWECPRDAAASSEYCVFHTPVSHSSRLERDVAEAFVSTVAADGRQTAGDPINHRRFIGATLPEIDLSYQVLRGQTTHPLDLRDVTVTGGFDVRESELWFPVLLDAATIDGVLNLRAASLKHSVQARTMTVGRLEADDAVFSKEFEIVDSEIQGGFLVRDASVAGNLTVQNCTISGACILHGTHVAGGLRVTESWIQSPVNLEQMTVEGSAAFDRVRCEGSVRASRSTVHGTVTFADAVVAGALQFSAATLHDGLDFTAGQLTGRGDFRKLDAETLVFDNTFVNAELRFDQAAVGTASFTTAELGGSVSFHDATIDETLNLQGCLLGGPLTAEAAAITRITTEDLQADVDDAPLLLSFVEASLDGGVLEVEPDAVVFDLSGVRLGDVELQNGSERTPLFEGIRFDKTTFDGFDFTDYESALRAVRWRLHSTISAFPGPDLDYTAREKTYLKAKNGAEAVGETRAAAEFFRRELLNRRYTHRAEMRTHPIGSRRWIDACYRWVSNWVFDKSAGYGERPRATVKTTFVTLGLFAVFYAVLLPSPPYDIGILGYGLFSLASFVTLIFGGVAPPETPVVQFLAQIEGLLGAFLIALFVFTLTRSVHR